MQIDGASHEQCGASQNDEHKRRLGCDESLAHPRSHRASRRSLPVSELVSEFTPANRLQRREQTHKCRAGQNHCQRGQNDGEIERGRFEARHARRRAGDEDRQQPPGQQDTGDAAETGEHHAFRQDLTDDAATAGANGGANRQLTGTGGKSCQQEIGDVCACDHQHQDDCGEQHEQSGAEIADHEVGQHLCRDAPFDVELRMIALEISSHALELLVDLCKRHISPAPAVHLEKMLVEHRQPLGRERSRHQELCCGGERVERGWHDADDLVRKPVQSDRPAHDAGIASEPALPQPRRQDDDLLTAGSVLVRPVEPSMQWRHAKHIVKVGRGSHAEDALGRAFVREVEAAVISSREMFKGRDLIPNVVVVPARCAPQLAPPGRERQQHPFWLIERVGTQHHGVDDTENGRCGADAQRESEDGCGREAWMKPALTQCEDDVLAEFIQPLSASNRPITAVTDRGELRVHAVYVAESANRLLTCGLWIQTAIDQLLRPQIDVMPELVADFYIDGNAPQERTEPLPDLHDVTMTLLTACAKVTHASVSLASC